MKKLSFLLGVCIVYIIQVPIFILLAGITIKQANIVFVIGSIINTILIIVANKIALRMMAKKITEQYLKKDEE